MTAMSDRALRQRLQNAEQMGRDTVLVPVDNLRGLLKTATQNATFNWYRIQSADTTQRIIITPIDKPDSRTGEASMYWQARCLISDPSFTELSINQARN